MSFIDWFSRRQQNGRIIFNKTNIASHWPDGTLQRLNWNDLAQVDVITTDEGPWAEDVFFLLLDTSGESIVVPQCFDGAQALVEQLAKLPTFDDSALRKAMGSTSNQTFVCWRRAP